MDKQEIFDKVAVHLLTQMKKSVITFFGCAYRSDDGLKCAIGCLIPDAKYKPVMEGKDVGDHVILDACGVSYDYKDFLNELQFIHDHITPKKWGSKLRALALRYNLSTAAIGNLK